MSHGKDVQEAGSASRRLQANDLLWAQHAAEGTTVDHAQVCTDLVEKHCYGIR